MADHLPTAAASVFTVHNLAFQGLFAHHDGADGAELTLHVAAGIEFHGQLSFMKAGLKFADKVTTVSPTYAPRSRPHEFGCGLDGVIRGGQATSAASSTHRRGGWSPQRCASPPLRQRPPGGKQRCRWTCSS